MGFLLWQISHGLREVTADLAGPGHTEPVGKPRCHIGFMDDGGDLLPAGGHHHRDTLLPQKLLPLL